MRTALWIMLMPLAAAILPHSKQRFCETHCNGRERPSSYPFLTGDTLRWRAQWIYDEEFSGVKLGWTAADVRRGDLVFVKTDLVQRFLADVHDNISAPYVLVTHNGAAQIPFSAYRRALDSRQLIVWFAQNADSRVHRKIRALPLGFENARWKRADWQRLASYRAAGQLKPWARRPTLLYANFNTKTHASRPALFAAMAALANRSQSIVATRLSVAHAGFIAALADSRFVLSPPGRGVDCHRTWEALLLGAVPIVKTSILDSLYRPLGILCLPDLLNLTVDALNYHARRYVRPSAALDVLYVDYWLDAMASEVRRYSD